MLKKYRKRIYLIPITHCHAPEPHVIQFINYTKSSKPSIKMSSALTTVIAFFISFMVVSNAWNLRSSYKLNIHNHEFKIEKVDNYYLTSVPFRHSKCFYPFERFLTDFDKHLFIQCLIKTELLDEIDAKTIEEASSFYSSHYGPLPSEFESWFRFAKANQCRINRYDQLNAQLRQFKRSPKDYKQILTLLPAFFNNTQLTKMSVKDGKVNITINSDRAAAYVPIFEKIQALLPNMNFLVNTHAQPIIMHRNRYTDGFLEENSLSKFNQNPSGVNMIDLTVQNPDRSNFTSTLRLRDLMSESCRADQYRNSLEQGYGLFINAPEEYQTLNLFPLLSWGGYPGCTNDILIPSVYHYEYRKLTEVKSDYPSWKYKSNTLLWRGATSGNPFYNNVHITYKPDHICTGYDVCTTNQTRITKPELYADRIWFYSHRQRAVTTSDLFQGILDIQFVNGAEMAVELQEETFKFYSKPWRLSFSRFFNSKFILDIDGNGYSGRFLKLLRGNSLIFAAHYATDWFSDIIIPFYHYVPVNMGYDKIDYTAIPREMREELVRKKLPNKFDFEHRDPTDKHNTPLGYNDLAPKALYYQKNLDFSEEMALRGQKFANQYLREEDMDCFIYRALIELHDILNKENKDAKQQKVNK
eukprot:NODE_648_length_5566_cov_0.226450.p1 type:complete len:640 gc:universal NODE_648_length_5566_cov_0.226450:3350-5269(+)